MKRTGHLFEKIVSLENLRVAFSLAAKGKCTRSEVIQFRSDFDHRIKELREAVVSGRFVYGTGVSFHVYDPKKRLIHAAVFEERILHHAVMIHCGPLLDRQLIPDTYACRKGKGRLLALARASRFAARSEWVLKCDIRKYFDSIPRVRAVEIVERQIKDTRVLQMFFDLLHPNSCPDERGLPIGSLISQHLANAYLSPLDRFVTEIRGFRYIRYMDDFLVFGKDYGALRELAGRISTFLKSELLLTLKRQGGIHCLKDGVDFLGYRLRRIESESRSKKDPARVCTTLNRRSRRRFKKKLGELEVERASGRICDLEFQRRSVALLEFTRHTRSNHWRRKVMREIQSEAIGVPPCGSRRQLEQPTQELPVLEPEQE